MKIEELINFNFEDSIKINYSLLEDFVEFLKKKFDFSQLKPIDWINNKFWLDPSEGPNRISQYFTIGNSINFKFWEFNKQEIIYVKGIKGSDEYQGSTYMWRCLKICIDNNSYPILEASFLSKIDIETMKNIFKTDYNEEVITNIKQRWLNWRNLGKILKEKYKGKFYNLIKISDNSIKYFINLSREFRAFDDPLCKMTMVNAIMHQGRKILNFGKDIFPGIDYHLITQVLRLGLLELNKNLIYKIKNKITINNQESSILRQATLKCLTLISDKLNVSGDKLDNILFKNGKKHCTHNLDCQREKNLCEFENFCIKKIKFFMPLENTRYY